MLAGVSVSADSVTKLASIARAAGADELAERLERAMRDEVRLLRLEIDERAIILNALDDPPQGLAELRGVLTTSISGSSVKDSIVRVERRWRRYRSASRGEGTE